MAERIIKNQKVMGDEEDVDRNKEYGQKFGYRYNAMIFSYCYNGFR